MYSLTPQDWALDNALIFKQTARRLAFDFSTQSLNTKGDLLFSLSAKTRVWSNIHKKASKKVDELLEAPEYSIQPYLNMLSYEND